MFVTTLVCLAAATVVSLRDDWQFAKNVQTVMSLALCVTFPAMLAGGVMQARGYARTCFIAALVPTLVPLVMVCDCVWVAVLDIHYFQKNGVQWSPVPPIKLWKALSALRQPSAVLWAMTPCSCIASLCLHWLLRFEGRRHQTTLAESRLVACLALLGTVVVGCELAADWAMEFRVGADVRGLVSTFLSLLLTAFLAVGAVHGRAYSRPFFLGGSVPILAAMAYSYGVVTSTAYIPRAEIGWRIGGHLGPPLATAASWAAGVLFGLACVLFHWLF